MTSTSHQSSPGSSAASSPAQKYIKYDECIGVGAFKHVFKCINITDGIEYAWNEINLEKLDPVTTSKIFQEIEFYKQLDHENVLYIYDVWFSDANLLIFTTEYVVGGSLRDYLKKVHFQIRLSVIQNWSRQILTAMDYLHRNQIIHRDLKAQNIYIDYVTGVLKIGDLGLATQKVFSDSDLIVNKQMSMVGTSEFMAPEIYFQKYNEKVDIYAFGMCLIELITKEYPYQECHHTMEIYQKVTQGVLPDAIKKVQNQQAYSLIVKCIQTKPDDRPTIYQILQDRFFTDNLENEVSSPQASASIKPKNSTSFRPVISCNTPFIGQKDEASKKPQLQIITSSSKCVSAYPPLTSKALQNTQTQFSPPLTDPVLAQQLHITCGNARVVDSQRVTEVLIYVGEQKLRWPISEKDTPEETLKMLYQFNTDLSKGLRDLIYVEFKRICKDLKEGVLGEQGL